MKSLYRVLSAVLAAILLTTTSLFAQVTWSPSFPTADDSITIVFHADRGNADLKDSTRVYIHTGIVTGGPTATGWTVTQGVWGTNDLPRKMTYLGNNLFKIRFHIRSFYQNIPQATRVYRLGMVFRNLSGSSVGRTDAGGDIFIPIYANSFAARFTFPLENPILADSGSNISFSGLSSQFTTLKIYKDNTLMQTVNSDTTIDWTLTNAQPGTGYIKLVASNGTLMARDSIAYSIRQGVVVQDVPAGLHSGINYVGDSSVILVLHAPLKTSSFVIGEFSNWQPDNRFYMKRSTDGRKFWTRIDHLIPGKEYPYQYLVDGIMKVADAYSDKILDPGNDASIPAITYPANQRVYPTGKTTGIVSVFQTGQTPYVWQSSNYQRPAKTDLIIQETLVRDYFARANYQSLKDTLAYLKKLGINCVQLMPVMEFEGNNSWGYNPSFHAALDKAYGTRDALKAFIDAAHSMNIAVVLDIVENHAMGGSPLAQMYWDAANSRPAANSPFFNAIPKHPFNVGNDFNHASPDTREYFDYVNQYWIREFHIDGYRFDLSKGFTQTNSGDDVGLWGNFDQSRIDILKHIKANIAAVDPGAFVILEHFAAQSEEQVLSANNMLLWGNMNNAFGQCSMGYLTDSDISYTSYKNHGFTAPNLVAFMESHDEERMMFRNLAYGNQNAALNYRIKDTLTGYERVKMCAALFMLSPGPKMVYEFEELGMEYSINRCTNGTISNDCRTVTKPNRWAALRNPARAALANTFAALNRLKLIEPALQGTSFSYAGGLAQCRRMTAASVTSSINVLANVSTTAGSISPNFSRTGTWYDYFSGDSITVASVSANISLAPGEWHVYTTTKYPRPDLTVLSNEPELLANNSANLIAMPNPSAGEISFSFNMQRAGTASIALRDMLGREAASLYANLGEGPQTITWNGVAKDGSNIAPGVYLAELLSGKTRQTIRVVIRP
ncbi:MAG: alpha-amylase family glycosyl hydrolase [Bacteroidota bacterium]